MGNPFLNDALDRAKKGRPEGFEDLFILTYKDAYRHAALFTRDEKDIWQMIRAVYTGLYQDEAELPEAADFLPLVFQRIDELGSQMFGDETLPAEDEISSYSISEEKAATILAQIEEESRFFEKADAQTPMQEYVLSILKGIASIGFIGLTVWLILFSVNRIHPGSLDITGIMSREVFSTLPSVDASTATAGESEEESSIPETETGDAGIQEFPEGKKYLTDSGTWLTDSWMEDEDRLYYFGEDGYAVVGEIILENRIYTFYDDGSLISMGRISGDDIPVGESLQQVDDYTYYLKKQNSETPGQDGYNLYRASREELDRNQRELVLSGIQDYLIYDMNIYYMQGYSLQKSHLSSSLLQVEEMEMKLINSQEAFYFVNDLEEPSPTANGSLTIDNRIYRVDDGRIKYVKPAQIQTRQVTYYLSATTQSAKGLCWKNASGQSGVLASDGYWIDSFCLVGDWIYYSVYLGKTDGVNRHSQIYRINIDGSGKEALASPFQGHMLNLYYYSELGQIYGEYTPDTGSNRGCIAAVSSSGRIERIDDSSARTGRSTTGEDTLELIMVSGDTVYCYWHDCNWDAAGGAQIIWTEPIELSASRRTAIN